MPEYQRDLQMICPECGWLLVVRENSKTGEKFIGCTKYPDCRYTRELTPYLVAKLSGHPTLF